MGDKKISLPVDAGEEDIVAFINASFETADIKQISRAIGAAMKLYSVTELAEMSDLKRESLYRAFGGGTKNANFTTVLNVLNAMGFRFRIEPRTGIRIPRRSRLARETATQEISD